MFTSDRKKIIHPSKKSLYRYHSILGRHGNILSLSGFQACQNFDVQFSVTSDKPIITIMHKAYA